MPSMFSHIDRVLNGSLSTDSQVATLPVSNLANTRVQKIWRTAATSAYFDVDFLGTSAIRILGLFGATLSDTDTVRHRLSAVSAGAGELLDTGAVATGLVSGYDQYLYILSAAVNARYWRCDISAPSRAALGYFDAGRAWAGDVWAPTIGFALGWSERWIDTSEVTRSRRSGATFVDEGVVYRELRLAFDALTEADRTSALDLERYAGRKGQLLFVPESTAAGLQREAILGRARDTSPMAQPNDSWPARYSKSYEIEQDL